MSHLSKTLNFHQNNMSTSTSPSNVVSFFPFTILHLNLMSICCSFLLPMFSLFLYHWSLTLLLLEISSLCVYHPLFPTLQASSLHNKYDCTQCLMIYRFVGVHVCVQIFIICSLFCSVPNYIKSCAIGPVTLDAKNTIFSDIPCRQGHHSQSQAFFHFPYSM